MKNVFILLMSIVSVSIYGQNWKTSNSNSEKVTFNEKLPDDFELYSFNKDVLKQKLATTNYRFTNTRGVKIKFPINNQAKIETFDVFETQFMEKELQHKFPTLKTYIGKNTKSGRSIYFTITPYEINFTILDPNGTTLFIKQYSENSWISFYLGAQHYFDSGFECEVSDSSTQNRSLENTLASDGTLRKYRYAVSVTGEYSTYTLTRLGISSSASNTDKKAAILGAMLTTVTRMNSVYERDVAISLQLVANNEQLIHLDASTDGFDNDTTTMSSLLTVNQSSIDSTIGAGNYDVGQVWCQGGLQGLARLGAVCSDGDKASGAARGQNVEADRFIISVASHELGHLFGAYHTFSNSNCGGARNDPTAIESGSGTTIMSYPGICSPNIQNYSDDRFNIASMGEITNFSINSATCSQNISLTNQSPVITTGNSRYIPISTPFVLEANVSDPDGDVLSIAWEEIDIPNGSVTTPPQSTWTNGPMFRPYPTSTNNKRYFPNLDTLLVNHLSHQWEVLPTVSRRLKFKATVRDNNTEGGQTASDYVIINVRDDAGPFETTSDLTTTVWTQNETRTITWNVANTTASPINCATVDILLSTDAGQIFPYVLLSDTPNDGSADIIVPNLSSPSARYMVKAHDNYFFSLNKGKIAIGDFQNHCESFNNTTQLTITDDDDVTGVESSINVIENHLINKVSVNINISHTYVSDLRFNLISPDGTEIILFNNNCSSEDNIDALYDDDGQVLACNSLANGSTFVPIQPLSVLIDTYTAGVWKLKAWDNHVGDEGIINSWSINLCYMQSTHVKNNEILDLSIYPNPTNSELFINFTPKNQKQKLLIYEVNGREIATYIFNEEQSFQKKIDIKNLKTGIYLLKIIDGDYSTVKRIIKK